MSELARSASFERPGLRVWRGRGAPEPRVVVRTQYVDVPPHRLFVRFSTELSPPRAMPVVLVHGPVISSRYMVPTLVQLAQEFPTYAPDLPGFGHSTKPKRLPSLSDRADVLASFLDAMHVDRAVILANSRGCQTAVEFALRHPDRLCGVVLQGPTPDPVDQGRAALWRWLSNGRAERASQLPLLVRDFFDSGPRRALGSFRQARREPISKNLSKVMVPALVVRGSRDPICPQQWAEHVARTLPQGRLAVIPGGPHTLTHARPSELTRLMAPFIRSLA